MSKVNPSKIARQWRLISDYRLLPEPSMVIDCFKKEFEKLLYLGLMLPPEGRPDARTTKALFYQQQGKP